MTRLTFSMAVLAVFLLAGSLQAKTVSTPRPGSKTDAAAIGPVRPAVSGSASRRLRTLDDVIISESFESTAVGSLPFGWSQADVDGGYCSWFTRSSTWESYSAPLFSAHTGIRFALCHYNDQSVANDDWLILPPQNIPGNITLSYWVAAQDSLYRESFEVRASTTGIQPSDFTQLIFSDTSVGTTWSERVHDLTAFSGIPFTIAFRYRSDDRFAIKIDDILLEGDLGSVGAISGVIHDDSGRVVRSAEVRIFELGRFVRSDETGRYFLPQIPVGDYNVRVSSEYYYLHTEPNVHVAAAETTAADITVRSRPLLFWDFVSQTNYRDIMDLDTAMMQINFYDTLAIWDLDVSVSLHHTSVGDLDIWLLSPESTRVDLAVHDPLVRGQNILGCRFDDEALLPFTAGQAPYAGRWRPAVPLSAFNGDTTVRVGGHSYWGRVWRLFVYDAAPQDVGRLEGFTMHIVTEIPVPAGDPRPTAPGDFRFEGNYPNPFNSQTRFRFTLPRPAAVTLTLYNALGQERSRILSRDLEAGDHIVVFDASGLASGVYFAQLSALGTQQTRKVLLLR